MVDDVTCLKDEHPALALRVIKFLGMSIDEQNWRQISKDLIEQGNLKDAVSIILDANIISEFDAFELVERVMELKIGKQFAVKIVKACG